LAQFAGASFGHHNPHFAGNADAVSAAMDENALQHPAKRLDVVRIFDDDSRCTSARRRSGGQDAATRLRHLGFRRSVRRDVKMLLGRYRTPVTSAVPALFISGTLDGRTPVANAEEVQRGFRNSAHVIIDGASHGDDLFLSTPAILENVLAFARQPHSRTVRVTVH
jgi:pimeloyl-ACP methyl ester carboxylesterase